MAKNLLSSGFINPKQLPLEQLRLEVAVVLQIPLPQIEHVECWPSQIRVKLVEGSGKFISYRRLPMWVEQGLAVIELCSDRASLDKLAEVLSVERDWYDDSEDPAVLQQWQQVISRWRVAWAKRAKEIQQEEKRLQPIIAHQQAGADWFSGWQQVLRFCKDCASLNRLAAEIELQSEEFFDLPEIIQAIRQLLHQRWNELSQAEA